MTQVATNLSADQVRPANSRRSAGMLEIAKLRLKEHLAFDSRLVKTINGLPVAVFGRLLYAGGLHRQGFDLLAKLHRSGFGRLAALLVEKLIQEAAQQSDGAVAVHPLNRLYERYVEATASEPTNAKFCENPGRLLKSNAIVIKSPRENEKGVLIISYSFVFPLFAFLFDLNAIARRYHIVLEPSWSGYCTPEILCYTRYPFPVFVQTYEPRDLEFIERCKTNLVPIRVAANWWVDHRLFRPRPEIAKDVDVIMVASWADFKRHHRLFAAVRAIRRRGIELKIVLLGYPQGRSREDICRRARYYEVLDLLEIHENIPSAAVAKHVARSKINILWSRKEGFNRAIIEAMFAGVPCILRAGFNYGYHYPYINPQTGCFATERELPERLIWMVKNYRNFQPQDWVMANMTCQQATQIVSDVIRKTAVASGEIWTTDLAVKTNNLHMGYWNTADEQRFEPDYAFLRSAIRSRQG